MLRAATGVDFRQYKLPTIARRLQRRIVLHKLAKLEEYVRLLRENPEEVLALYGDILIHVTRFFREPDSFEALAEHVVPRILSDHPAEAPLRAWVALTCTIAAPSPMASARRLDCWLRSPAAMFTPMAPLLPASARSAIRVCAR